MSSSPALDTALAFNRFGLGATPRGHDAGDVRDMLHREIDRGAPVVGRDGELPDTPALLADLNALNELQRLQRKQGITDPPRDGRVAARFNDEIDARYNGTVRQPAVGFNERLAMFWANHFAVQVSKSRAVRITAGAFEREAIRPNIFGRFTDLVLSVETHPCMLNFLDNATSVGPDSPGADNGRLGLNENLAREIMELHVLGVDSGYTQADVTAFAKALTGWTVNRDDDPDVPYGDFIFDKRNHEPASQVILGRRYGNEGFFQAADVLTDMCARPAAARFIATKLARHFVSDTPPRDLIDRLADVFNRTGGDLGEVSHALIEADEAWAPQTTKLRPPQEYYAAMLRAADVELAPSTMNRHLNAMGQRQWDPSGPNGFSDAFAVWATPEGLTGRLGAAREVASQVPDGVDPRLVADAILGARQGDATRDAVAHAESTQQGLTLLFLSPEFMRR